MLALIAGQGALPALVFDQLAEKPLVAELEGYASEVTTADPLRFRVEQLGSFLQTLKSQEVTEVCFAGKVARPKLDPSAIDAATMPFVPRIVAAIQAGDDGALRAVLEIFEEAGFEIRAAHDVLPHLLPESELYSDNTPSDRDVKDAERGQSIVTALSAADTGQSCVVAAGQALAIEALGGTDWMLASLSDGHRPAGPDGGLLFKAAKVDQDRRVDLPVVGPNTLRAAARAELAGVVVESGSVMVLDLPHMQALANELGLFFWVRERS